MWTEVVTEKICIIRDHYRGDYTLEVDDQEIPFIGDWNAEYFEEHYKKLGYKVTREYQRKSLLF